MSGYEVEHNIKPPTTAQPTPRRPDLSTFFSALDTVDTTGTRAPQNTNSLPLPGDISAAYRLLANAFDMMRGPNAAQSDAAPNGSGSGSASAHDDLMTTLITSLMEGAEQPPTELKGVPDEFLSELERVPKKSLKEDMSCPICGNGFLEDKYPLVVRLPCHKDHFFDLECITPWLKLQATCPLDRKTVWKKREKEVVVKDEEEEEFDDMYA